MACHDPIGDMLAKIKNAVLVKKEKLIIYPSKEKIEIIKILKNEGYIKNFKKIMDKDRFLIKIFLKYDETGNAVIENVKRISKPGRRVYLGYKSIPRLYNGIGTIIVSTSSGITTAKKAVERKIGGEVLCSIW